MRIIYARDYGIFPNTGEDCTISFNGMLQAHPSDTHFILDKGQYVFSSQSALLSNYYISNTNVAHPRSLSMLFKGMKNIIFEGNGSNFLYSGQTIPLTLDSCEDINLKNITIDWQIPLSAEGQIVATSTEWVDIAINPERYPHSIKEDRLWFKGEYWETPYYAFCEFDQVTKKVAYNTGDTFHTTRQSEIAPGIIRFYGDFKQTCPTIGNYGVIRHNKRIHPGIFLHHSQDVTVSNVVIHNTGGLGLLAQFCTNLTFNGIRFEANRGAGRMFISGHDDGLHLSNNSGEITIENCYFYGLMDDPINVHGTSLRITEKIDAHTLKGIFVHEQTIGFDLWAEKGDLISFIDHLNMSSYCTTLATSFKLLSPSEFVITFEDEIPSSVQIGDALENLTHTPSVICRNNYFGSCRARGMLISTPQPVLIEHNIFESAGSAILIAGDANSWYESGACHDISIRGNHFSDCCMSSIYQFCEGIISICPEIPAPELEKPFHRNISITNNTFQSFDYAVLYALSVKGLTFSHNKIIRSYVYKPFGKRSHMLNLEFCQDVVVQDNLLIGDVLGKDIGIGQMKKEHVSILPLDALEIVEEEAMVTPF